MVDHDRKLLAFLERCRQRHIKLNRMKFKLPQLSYVGHVISPEGLKPDPAKAEAKKRLNMPPPADKQSLGRIMGTVSYLQKFAPGLSELIPLQSESYLRMLLNLFGVSASSVLKESTCIKVLRPSRSLSDAEWATSCLCFSFSNRNVNGVQLCQSDGKEPLAIVFGIEKFEPYRYGRTFKVETDHKQLESILKKNFLSALKRLERMMLCLKNFDFEVEYKKGIYPIHLAERTSTWPGQVFILLWTLELLLSKMLTVLMR